MPVVCPDANVLIIAPGEDLHALAVAERIARLYGDSVHCRIFDPATYPMFSRLTAELEGTRSCPTLAVAASLGRTLGPKASALLAGTRRDTDEPLALGHGTKVWWRRYRRPLLHPDVVEPEFQHFCADILQSTLFAALSLCEVHNPIDAERAADRKLLQLFAAQQTGFNVPRSLVCSTEADALKFVELIEQEGRRVIYKNASPVPAFSMPTRIVDRATRHRFDTLKYAPALFQEEISGGPDLRIAVIGERVFCCEWRGGCPERRFVDIRLEKDLCMFPAKEPPELRENLLALQRRLGLSIGIYDFKLDREGQPFFLEVNPSGQWLDLEIDAGNPVSEALARLLVEGPEATTRRSTLLPFVQDDLQQLAARYFPPEPELEWTKVWQADDRVE